MSADHPLELFQAYRRGLRHRRASVPKDVDFSALITHAILSWPHTRERIFLRETSRLAYQGLLACREGRHGRARSFFEQARQKLDGLGGGHEQIGIALYEAAVAYLDHREGRHDRARTRVGRVLDADLILERDYGLPLMLLHRVQQGHNLARVDMRQGRRQQAIRLCGLLIAFLEDRIDTVPFHHSWSSKCLRGLSGYLLRGIIGQIVGEVASHLATGPDQDVEWDIFLDAARPQPPSRTTRFPQVQHALCARIALRQGDRDTWFRHLRQFLAPGPVFCPDLFYATVIAFAEECRSSSSPWGSDVAQAIERDSAKWRSCNPFLRQRLLRVA